MKFKVRNLQGQSNVFCLSETYFSINKTKYSLRSIASVLDLYSLKQQEYITINFIKYYFALSNTISESKHSTVFGKQRTMRHRKGKVESKERTLVNYRKTLISLLKEIKFDREMAGV